jgi:thioredoxin 2
MVTSPTVACPSCGKKNRMPGATSGRPVCGACRADLPWIVDATTATFDAAVGSSVPVLVDLWAPWCGPCRMVAPVLEQLATERAGRIKVVKVNVDDSPEVSARYQVRGIPTLLLLDGGRLVATQVGAVPAPALRQWLDANVTTSS